MFTTVVWLYNDPFRITGLVYSNVASHSLIYMEVKSIKLMHYKPPFIVHVRVQGLLYIKLYCITENKHLSYKSGHGTHIPVL